MGQKIGRDIERGYWRVGSGEGCISIGCGVGLCKGRRGLGIGLVGFLYRYGDGEDRFIRSVVFVQFCGVDEWRFLFEKGGEVCWLGGGFLLKDC